VVADCVVGVPVGVLVGVDVGVLVGVGVGVLVGVGVDVLVGVGVPVGVSVDIGVDDGDAGAEDGVTGLDVPCDGEAEAAHEALAGCGPITLRGAPSKPVPAPKVPSPAVVSGEAVPLPPWPRQRSAAGGMVARNGLPGAGEAEARPNPVALLDWAAPGLVPGGLPPPGLWLEPLTSPVNVARTAPRSWGTASVAPITMSTAVMAASAGRSHMAGDRST
jgi:hypothetical protein